MDIKSWEYFVSVCKIFAQYLLNNIACCHSVLSLFYLTTQIEFPSNDCRYALHHLMSSVMKNRQSTTKCLFLIINIVWKSIAIRLILKHLRLELKFVLYSTKFRIKTIRSLPYSISLLAHIFGEVVSSANFRTNESILVFRVEIMFLNLQSEWKLNQGQLFILSFEKFIEELSPRKYGGNDKSMRRTERWACKSNVRVVDSSNFSSSVRYITTKFMARGLWGEIFLRRFAFYLRYQTSKWQNEKNLLILQTRMNMTLLSLELGQQVRVKQFSYI